MKLSKRLSWIVCLGSIAVVIGLSFRVLGDAATNVVNVGNQNFYQDENGDIWESKSVYDSQDKKDYFVAPDGSIWENEYRYLESQN